MNTYDQYARPFPESWFPALSRLCREIGVLMHNIGDVEPELKTSEKAYIQDYFQSDDVNLAILPEEICRAVSDFNGGCLYSLSSMLENSFVSPVIVAPLARSAVENSCLLLYVNSFAPIERCFWTMRSLTDKIQYEKEREMIPGLYDSYKRATKIHTLKNPGQEFKFPSNTALVSEMLKDIDGSTIYRTLSSYTHQHTWTALKHFMFVKANPISVELRSIDMVVSTLQAVERAVRSLAATRPANDTKIQLEHLDALVPYLTTIRHQVFTWGAENKIGPAP